MLVHILVLIIAAPLWDESGAASVECPATCECSESFEDLLSITCPGVSALMLPNETLQVDCVGRAAAVQLPAAPEVSLTNCAPDAFARVDTRTLFLRNLSTTGPVRVGTWPSLVKLDVSNNKLEILSTRFLSGLYSLTQLDLSKCQLHYLYPFCFHGFTVLKELYLEDNKLIEIEDNQFDQLSSLWLLHLWGNKLSRLSNNSFAGLSELRHLDLSHNRLATLSPAVLAPLKQLEHLDLSENRFRTLSSDLLLHNRKLQLFKLERNLMQTMDEPDAEWLQGLQLPQGLLSDLSRLTWVSVADSAVAKLPRFLLRGSPILSHLDLRGNQLTTIPRFFLQDALCLRWLDLSANRIETFSDDLLSQLDGRSLHHLNLSENALDNLPPGRVYNSVRVLDVRGNRLQSFSHDIVQQLSNNTLLREFFFTRGNLWNCQSRHTKELLAFASRVTFNGVATDYLGACSD